MVMNDLRTTALTSGADNSGICSSECLSCHPGADVHVLSQRSGAISLDRGEMEKLDVAENGFEGSPKSLYHVALASRWRT